MPDPSDTRAAFATVDLVTPPSSPAPAAGGDDDVVKRDGTGGDPMYDSDEPVEVQPQPSKKQRVEAAAMASSTSVGDHDDCVITGSSGLNPLVDFAHGRWNCCKVPIKTNPARSFCQKCHCVVCDTPANQCQAWNEHCSADPMDPEVRKKRAAFQKQNGFNARNCHLNQLIQIYPTEVDVAVNSVSLKTYQRQCVSWMLDIERSGFKVSRLVESEDASMPTIINGGLVALEMGMGKTLCIIATCLTNRIPTLVVAPALTCVQWVAQTKQYAPELSVVMLYCETQAKIESSLLNTDIVVVNSTSNLLESIMKRVGRVVVDESHQIFSGKSNHGAAVKFLHNLGDYPNVKSTWLISGTPFGHSERMDDPAFDRQMKVLLRRKHTGGWVYKPAATTADVKALVMRMRKAQTFETAAGSTSAFMPIPEIEYRTLQVGLQPMERELYNIAACVDGWTQTAFCIENKRNADDIVKDLDVRFALRKLILGERIFEFECEVKKRMDECFYNPDSEAPDLFYAKVDRMSKRITECCKALQSSNSKIDAVLEEIASLRSNDPNFKAVIITESDGAGRYIKEKLGSAAGVMQRSKGRTSVREQRELLKFQMGEYEVLVCSFESVRIGTNLDQACAIYFVDNSINDTDHKQACARISRCGTKHSNLTATFVYVQQTLSEEIYKYHEDRRSGKSIEQAAARFEQDEPHHFSKPHDFRRLHYGRPFDKMKFTFQRMPDSVLADLMTSDMDINDMFEMICDSEKKDDSFEVQITLTIEAGKRPALYDVAKEIIVTGNTQSSFRIVFDLPKASTFDHAEILTTKIKLTEQEAEILSSMNSWHTNVSSAQAPVKLSMLLTAGQSVDMLETVAVIKASCSSCKWCGWRKVHSYSAPFSGCAPVFYSDAGANRIPNDAVLKVKDEQGTLRAIVNYDGLDRTIKGHEYSPFTDQLRAEIEIARKDHRRMGIVPSRLRHDRLTQNFFASRPSVYQKVLVKLKDANINDTIRFNYKDRHYEVFIREIIPTGLDWFAVAYVVERQKPDSTIIIDEHSLVDMKRVIAIREDALSLRDIIRMLRDDSVKTQSLKDIMLRSDIDDAKKLELAAALV